MKVELPFPSSILAGHAKGNGQWAKVKATKDHREWARLATLAVFDKAELREHEGDIAITIRFIPPDRRGDRMNFPARMKPYIDGIADVLGVNDRRFHPLFVFCEPAKPGCVEVYIGLSSVAFAKNAHCQPSGAIPGAVDMKTARAEPRKRRSGHNQIALQERLA